MCLDFRRVLFRLGSVAASATDYATAIAFCHGGLAGAYGSFVGTVPPADRFICPPKPQPTRSQVANGFVEPVAADASPEQCFQFERQGYFARDPESTAQHLVFNRTIGLRDTFAKEVGGKG